MKRENVLVLFLKISLEKLLLLSYVDEDDDGHLLGQNVNVLQQECVGVISILNLRFFSKCSSFLYQ